MDDCGAVIKKYSTLALNRTGNSDRIKIKIYYNCNYTKQIIIALLLCYWKQIDKYTNGTYEGTGLLCLLPYEMLLKIITFL